MICTPLPPDEDLRLASLRSLAILDTSPEERFDRITRIAMRLFDVPMAAVSLIDENRQWFKSQQGLDVAETTRDLSFCAHAILGSDAFVVADALNDQRFCDNPLVTGPPHVRFYAGYPVALPSGAKLGTLCILDHEPRSFGDEDAAMLHDLAKIVEHELASLQLATIDDLTQVCNRRGFERLSAHALEMCGRLDLPVQLLYLDIDGFKGINDGYGHAEGDATLREFARALEETFRGSDVVGRIGGDAFAVLVTNSTLDGTGFALRRLEQILGDEQSRGARAYAVQYSVGMLSIDAVEQKDIQLLMNAAEELMYRTKHGKRALG